MSTVVKVIEVLAESEKSWEDAAQVALTEASKTLRNIRSICIENLVASVENNTIKTYRVNAKISFDLESARPQKQGTTASTQRRR
ncbi:MAG TPA: dodecin family protein [Chthoniobacterales bacterium]